MTAVSWEERIGESVLLRSVRAVRLRIKNLKKEAKRPGPKQIALLKKNGNTSPDWKKVLFSGKTDLSRIRNNTFSGDVLIAGQAGRLTVGADTEMETGVYGSVIRDCVIDRDVLLRDNSFLGNVYIGERSVLINNGTVISKKNPACGNGLSVAVGIETGGREVLSFAELSFGDAVSMAMKRSDRGLQEAYASGIKKYAAEALFEKGIIFKKSRLLNNGVVKDSFIGEAAQIENCLKVENSTLLSSEEEAVKVSDGAFVKDSILQWGCRVLSMAIVEGSVMTEHSEAERHGKVINSIIGPNTGVAEGEVNASLVGPFAGFHHQALLIAALWPEGKGNVGYGANVGSNHTGKAADQEVIPGEGMFFGLGCNIKFPADFSRAPYSIVSTGVTTLPQRVEYPFSLINLPAANLPAVSPAYNEIFPAWVLSDNLYAIRRNESKYMKRNKARRNRFVFEVFRPGIMEMVLQARDRLKGVTPVRESYTEREVPGLGKNYLLEESRKDACETYTFFLRYYALKGLMKQLRDLTGSGKIRVTLSAFERIRNDRRWEHERGILQKEFGVHADLKELLKQYIQCEETIAGMIKSSKQKDDIRGRKIIPDYDLCHTPAEKEGLVTETYGQLEILKAEAESIIPLID